MSNDLTIGGKVLPITRWGEPVMHARTHRVRYFDEELQDLVRDMFASMRAAKGVGLAATQIGRDVSVFVFECPDADEVIHRGVVCNPQISVPDTRERKLDSGNEGCLSFPGGYAVLARPDTVICQGQDAFGNLIKVEGTGLLARCLQHETDHLNGIVFGDRLSTRARRGLNRQHEELAHLYPADWPVSPRLTSADEAASEQAVVGEPADGAPSLAGNQKAKSKRTKKKKRATRSASSSAAS